MFSLLPFILTFSSLFLFQRRHLKTKSHRKEKSPNKKDWGSWLVHSPGSDREFNRIFYGFFQLLTRNSKGNSVDTTGKNAFKLVKLPSLKEIRLEREKI